MSPTDRKNAANGDRNDSGRVVQKLWSYCHVLRDDGLSHQDYLEQLTQLLFLKMAELRALTRLAHPPRVSHGIPATGATGCDTVCF